MINSIKVSIIVPVYNVEKYVSRCFNSIAGQTYSNIECIFVDDCSPDKSRKLLKKKISDYEGKIVFKVIRLFENRGLSEARNIGTLESEGDYIYYLDSDDELFFDSIEKLVSFAVKYAGVDIVQGNTKTIPKPKDDRMSLNLFRVPEYTKKKFWIKSHCLKEPRIPTNAWNKLINRRFLIENKLFFKAEIIHEDEHWMFLVAKKLNSIAFCKSYTYKHYVTEGSIMQSGYNSRSFKSWYVILNDSWINIDEENINAQKSFIFRGIKDNLLRIYVCNDCDYSVYRDYKSFIKRIIKKSASEFSFIECIFLYMLLLPLPVLNTSFLKKFLNFFLKVIF